MLDAETSWFTSFGYFNDRENMKVLKNIYKHLRDNGIFLLDIPNKKVMTKIILSNPIIVNKHKNIFEITESEIIYKYKQTFWNLKRSFYLNFKDYLKLVRTDKLKVRLYTLSEIKKFLLRCGFRV